MTFNPTQMVNEAVERIRPFLRQTILDAAPAYSQRTGAEVYFKCENLQHTGSFKARGALNKILSLDEGERARGIVTASTGNHGAACAFAMQQVGASGIVFVPETAVPTKLAAIRRLGADIRTFGTDSIETEAHARTFATENGMTYVPPYNDPFVIAGQGTIAAELLHQLPELDAVFVSVGGGGLIGGIASFLKAVKPSVQVIGCSPENSQVMAQSVAAGELLDLPSLPTLSDGTAGGVEPGSITFPLCRDHVDQYISVTEAEIATSLREFMGNQHMLIEGSAAVAIAAFLKTAVSFKGQRVAIVLCGANISLDTLKVIL
ncbi:MAG: threonine/serine dehydratase [Chloroflexi bacterium]|nr:MAG: threonine/serine dehydratase [Chloroflexota bacterium]